MFLKLTSLTSLPHRHLADAGEQEEQGGGDQEGDDDHGHPILGLGHFISLLSGRVVSLVAVAGVIVRGSIASVGHSVARVGGRLVARRGFLISGGDRGCDGPVVGVMSVVTSHSVRQAE